MFGLWRRGINHPSGPKPGFEKKKGGLEDDRQGWVQDTGHKWDRILPGKRVCRIQGKKGLNDTDCRFVDTNGTTGYQKTVELPDDRHGWDCWILDKGRGQWRTAGYQYNLPLCCYWSIFFAMTLKLFFARFSTKQKGCLDDDKKMLFSSCSAFRFVLCVCLPLGGCWWIFTVMGLKQTFLLQGFMWEKISMICSVKKFKNCLAPKPKKAILIEIWWKTEKL